MIFKLLGTILFGGLFGLALIVAGIGRIRQAFRGAGKVESVFWGTVGIGLGVALLAGVAWIMHPPPPDDNSTEVNAPSDRPFFIDERGK